MITNMPPSIVSILFVLLVEVTVGLSNSPPQRVLVTGAAGRTGRLVFEKLREDNRFEPKALVRTERSGRKLVKESNCGLGNIFVCDVVNDLAKGPPEGLESIDSMVICTSAVPVISKLSLVRAFLLIPVNLLRRKKAIDFRSLRFKFKKGQYPEIVDYDGQVAQIELARRLGAKRVVIVSSMGGTDPANFLNSVGKKADGSGNGDILLWKRKAERYLVNSGLSYTIIHPGGLNDNEPGKEDIVLNVDDELMMNKKRSISRADVAELCVAALTVGQKYDYSVSLDCITQPTEEGMAPKSAEEVLEAFLKTGKTANYAL